MAVKTRRRNDGVSVSWMCFGVVLLLSVTTRTTTALRRIEESAFASSSSSSSYDDDENNRRDLAVESGPSLYRPEEDEAQFPVIVTLVTETTDLTHLCHSMKTLHYFHGDDHAAPLLLFDGTVSGLLRGPVDALEHCAQPRRLLVHSADLEWLGDDDVGDEWMRPSLQELFFWTSAVWKHPALAPYDVVVKLTHEACFTQPSSYLPDLSAPHLLYHGEQAMDAQVDELPHEHGIRALWELALDFVETHSEMPDFGEEEEEDTTAAATVPLPRHVGLWSTLQAMWKQKGSLPMLNVNAFEVVSMQLMTHPLVQTWQDTVVQHQHDILRQALQTHKRPFVWQLSTIRFLTVALFVPPSQLDVRPIDGFVQKDIVRMSEGGGGGGIHGMCTPNPHTMNVPTE